MEMSLRVLREEYLDTLTSIANLVLTFWNQRQWKETKKLEVQVMEISLRALRDKHLDTLSSIANLVLIYRN